MKRNIYKYAKIVVLCMVSSLLSCINDIEITYTSNTNIDSGREFLATAPQADSQTRTSITEELSVVWEEADEVAIFDGVDIASKYNVTDGVGTGVAMLSMSAKAEDGGDVLSRNIAVYPYCDSLKYGPEGISTYLPPRQYYKPNSFGTGANLMVACTETTEDAELSFVNVLGALRIKVLGDKAVKRVVLKSNSVDYISGTCNISLSDVPTIAMSDAGDEANREIKLICSEPVQLSKTEATAFWFMLPAVTYENGFTVTIYCEDGSYMTKSTNRSITIVRSGVKSMAQFEYEETGNDIDREALIEIYKAANGDQWEWNNNWCSDEPISKWDGVYTNEQGRCIIISLSDNNLSGTISPCIGDLSELESLRLDFNWYLEGATFPSEIMNLSKLRYISVISCNMVGPLPESLLESELFKDNWNEILPGNKFELEDCEIYAPLGEKIDMDGEPWNLTEEYASHKYTMVYQWVTWNGNEPTNYLKNLYERYKDYGLGFVGSFISDEADYSNYVESMNIPWRSFRTGYELCSIFPSYALVDSTGRILWHTQFLVNKDIVNFETFLYKELGRGDVKEYYASEDYSADGTVRVLQKATQGQGINVVILGDTYNDIQVKNGDFDRDADYAYSQLFTIEPYKSFKELFNVYAITTVSKHGEYFYEKQSALSTNFGGGTYVYGNDNKCFEYALSVLSENDINNALFIVIMNSRQYAGTCFMYYPTDTKSDYSEGPSIAYFPLGSSETGTESFSALLHHEACGHGFAKLADEYAYEYMGAVPADYVSQTQTQQRDWGWWKNVDFTSDPTAIRWSHFINDTRYANEGLGAFEGGLTYWSGVWRPTEDSIMRYNVGGFNAPSREAIYYRIHKLAYGDSWTYDYEKFVEWDSINRKSSAAQAASRPMVFKPYEPTAPPVVVGKSWREALGR